MARRNPNSLRERIAKKRLDSATKTGSAPPLAGRLRWTEPNSGAALASGTRLSVSLAELSLHVPRSTHSSWELQFDAELRTSTETGESLTTSWSSGLLRRAPDGRPLDLRDVVLFEGPVHGHLSLDLEMVELDVGAQSASPGLGKLLVGAAGSLVGLPSGAGSLASGLVSNLMKLNANDQLLKHSTSLYTAEFDAPELLPLRTGRHELLATGGPLGRDGRLNLLLDVRAAADRSEPAGPLGSPH